MYEVIVGNIGTVSRSSSASVAERHFASYVEDSKQPHGRASGEPVTLRTPQSLPKPQRKRRRYSAPNAQEKTNTACSAKEPRK